SLSRFSPGLPSGPVFRAPGPHGWYLAGQGGVACRGCAEHDAGRASGPAVRWLDAIGRAALESAGELTPALPVRREARAMLYGFVEYHLERRMRSFALLARPSTATAHEPTLLPT